MPQQTRASAARGSLVALALAALSSAGCVDTDPAVFVEVSILSPSATVAQHTLVSTISGSFTIRLHLGSRASGPAVVGLGALSVTNRDQTTTFVDVLQVETVPDFPVTVAVDTDVEAGVTFSEQDNELETTVYDAICQSDVIAIAAVLDDSLRGGPVTTRSSVFAPAGCP